MTGFLAGVALGAVLVLIPVAFVRLRRPSLPAALSTQSPDVETLAAQAAAAERERTYADLHDDLGVRLLELIYAAPEQASADRARAILHDLRDVVSRSPRPSEPGGDAARHRRWPAAVVGEHCPTPAAPLRTAGAAARRRSRGGGADRARKDVLQLIGKGLTVAEAAAAQGLSRHTCAGYVKEIYRKLRVRSRAEAALAATRLGLVGRDA